MNARKTVFVVVAYLFIAAAAICALETLSEQLVDEVGTGARAVLTVASAPWYLWPDDAANGTDPRTARRTP